jgi:hypothetical protein
MAVEVVGCGQVDWWMDAAAGDPIIASQERWLPRPCVWPPKLSCVCGTVMQRAVGLSATETAGGAVCMGRRGRRGRAR